MNLEHHNAPGGNLNEHAPPHLMKERLQQEFSILLHTSNMFSRKKMADLLGENSNHFDGLFKDLEDWEAILTSLPDFDVGDFSPSEE